ncbi:hypothetical protein [Mycolicibacterium neworleansense]|uniref:Lipoprotein n=1 Tax=Mycolicibacterium neworleansense TaxID=146018 RepID=A0A0H5RWT2_9MYCO|nr:hypothetical protein [Mycolicibacterium neworleansense]MCV7362379.1 hypothetical protein [Mycolicibacterium neworleansense]CRZ13209.1 hypothetical protein BN2156_00039 [Mycolicibacterium neworleansense]
MSKRIVAIVLAVMVIAVGCGKGDDSAAQTVTPGHAQASPSGTYTAFAEPGQEENGDAPWAVVVRDKAGKEVFHDHSSYSARNGVMITWLPTEPEQLWVYSGDAGVYRIAPGSQGGWTRAGVKPENVPSEVTRLWESSRS